jgi:hypothetical protein
MRRTESFAFLAVPALVFLALVRPASAQCVTFEKPEELFAHSTAVFRGTVTATDSTGARGAHEIVAVATFRVEESWKGALERHVRLESDRPFVTGEEYLVFAAGEPLSTSILCRWAEPLRNAKAKLDWLSKRKRGAKPGRSRDTRGPRRDGTALEDENGGRY